MEYDVYKPANNGEQEPARPYTITDLKSDGRLLTQEIKHKGQLECLKPYVAYKLHKPDPLVLLIDEIATEFQASRPLVQVILSYLNRKGLLKVDGQPSKPEKDWLDHKLDALGISYDASRRLIR